tara:strand:+ start:445 stop:558 length:114 start_codon:yes stop_codon:yes gene_type:complete
MKASHLVELGSLKDSQSKLLEEAAAAATLAVGTTAAA